jgi:hypothetical protein
VSEINEGEFGQYLASVEDRDVLSRFVVWMAVNRYEVPTSVADNNIGALSRSVSLVGG